MIKKVLIIVLVIVVVMQFFRIDKINPEILANDDFITVMHPNTEITSILESACYNCHSNKTSYSWTSNIAPFSWMVQDDLEEAKEHLNFSKWGTYTEEQRTHKLEECYEEVEENEMPTSNSTWLHGQEEFDEEDKKKLERWFKRFGALESGDSDGD